MNPIERQTDSNIELDGRGEVKNHLAGESSPYLKQHVHNPVDWYPWCDDALERARRQNKPIFLSIGYSACHWCHVMERESFTDHEIAEFLNEHFISIKVDREERPDIDEIYMTAVQILTGGGGWPLNVFLTPELEPFYGGTYFPPSDGHGLPGFKSLLQFIANIWEKDPEQVTNSAANLTNAIRSSVDRTDAGGPVEEAMRQNAVASLERRFDPVWGGFGGAPKFPPTGSLAFLLRHHRRTGSSKSLHMATLTLDRMAQGGMHDQVGGGFHRYSVDERWFVPHFEKMLYDNALLARVYLDAALLTGNERYREVADRTLDFVLRDMRDPSGGFHCALDADSDGEEGKFYVWRKDEIMEVLGPEDGVTFCEYFDVSEAGNFECSNILNHSGEAEQKFAERLGSLEELRRRLATWNEQLRKVRDERQWPDKDDKILASWNGLMISALARGYRVSRKEAYLQAANTAADFVLGEMVVGGKLRHGLAGSSNGDRIRKIGVPAFLDDYAEMANALIDLYETTLDHTRLDSAISLTRQMIADFHDAEGGGFFFTAASHGDLLVRTKPYQDGAVPSGNSTAALVLLRLARFLDDQDLRNKALEIFSRVQKLASAHPEAFTQLLQAIDFHLDPAAEVVIAGYRGRDDTSRMLSVVQERFAPNETVALAEPGREESQQRASDSPLFEDKAMRNDLATAYVCEGYRCHEPVSDPDELRRLLAECDEELN